MSQDRPENQAERELLRRFSRGLREAAELCPGELELAAYVDGLSSDADRERIESHLALCESCLDAVILSRGLAQAPEAPATLVTRARALVPGRRALGRPRTWRRAAGWAAAAAAAVAMGFAGLRAGSAIRERGQTAAWVAEEVAFQPPAACRGLLSSADILGDLAREGHHE